MNTEEKHFVDNCKSFDYYVRMANGYGKDRIDETIKNAMILNWMLVLEHSFQRVLNATLKK